LYLLKYKIIAIMCSEILSERLKKLSFRPEIKYSFLKVSIDERNQMEK
jgi:hypothetical protein